MKAKHIHKWQFIDKHIRTEYISLLGIALPSDEPATLIFACDCGLTKRVEEKESE